MKTYKVIYDKYKFDETLERGIKSEGFVTVQAEALRIEGGALLFCGSLTSDIVAAFAEGQWDYVVQEVHGN